MASLPDQRRDFVLKLMEFGPGKKAAAKAAEAVGFSQWHGYKLMRDPRILAAIREEATKQLTGSVLVGVKTLIEIASNDKHKDQYKAAKELVGLNGFTSEQRVVVKHVPRDSRTVIRDLKASAKAFGADPEQFLAMLGIVEAEFNEVETEATARPV